MKTKAKNITLIIILVAISAIVGVILYFDKKKAKENGSTTKLPTMQAQMKPISAETLQSLREELNNNETDDTEDDESTNKLPVIHAQMKPISLVMPSIQPSVTKGNNFDYIVDARKGHDYFIGM